MLSYCRNEPFSTEAYKGNYNRERVVEMIYGGKREIKQELKMKGCMYVCARGDFLLGELFSVSWKNIHGE